MNKHILIILLLAVTTFNFGCRQASNEKQDDPAAPKDSVVSQLVKPSKSGYAEVNGLKMYYRRNAGTWPPKRRQCLTNFELHPSFDLSK